MTRDGGRQLLPGLLCLGGETRVGGHEAVHIHVDRSGMAPSQSEPDATCQVPDLGSGHRAEQAATFSAAEAPARAARPLEATEAIGVRYLRQARKELRHLESVGRITTRNGVACPAVSTMRPGKASAGRWLSRFASAPRAWRPPRRTVMFLTFDFFTTTSSVRPLRRSVFTAS